MKKKHQISGQILVETAYSILEWVGVLTRETDVQTGEGWAERRRRECSFKQRRGRERRQIRFFEVMKGD